MEEFSEESLKLSATICSGYSCMQSSQQASVKTRVCLVDKAAGNVDLIQALKHLDTPYLTSKDGSEYMDCDDPQYETIFVLEEFEGEIFHKLQYSDNRVLGTPVVMYVAAINEPLPYTYRPQYSSSMQGLNLCFANFQTKEHMEKLITLCHFMGASIKKDISAKIDYFITDELHGSKYRMVVNLGIPVLKEDWVHLCWAERKRFGVRASDDEFVVPCKSKPFQGCILSFFGFSDKESQHMQEQAVQQGAQTANVDDSSCTHLVVDEGNVKSLLFRPHGRIYIVIQEWFWGSIQIEARAEESLYLFEVTEKRPTLNRSSACSSSLGSPQKWKNSTEKSSLSGASSPSKLSLSKKRSRLREQTLAKLSQESDWEYSTPKKRQSTDTSACNNKSFCDISNNAAAARSSKAPVLLKDSPNAKKPVISARYQVAIEFLQTEKNYIEILGTILNLFKKPLEDPKQMGGSILPAENIKAIFGSIPKIYSIHALMAADLSQLLENWSDSSCIGSVVQKYVKEFVRCYPPFVNFFEMSKEMIDTCESTMPRFNAFLKINQAKKECGRQTLAELLINPVQRLPRIILLLQDIKKHTERENESHADVTGIQAALNDVKEALSHINEDKRKTESQKQIFDIVYEVDGCPPTVVSSHRRFITRAELSTVDDNLTNKGNHVCLFLLSDCVEIAKRKRRMKTHSFRSPFRSKSNAGVRCLKHIKLISLSHIRKVVDIKNSEECQSMFGLFCRTPTDTQYWLYTFKMLSCASSCGDAQLEDKATLTQEDRKMTLLHLLARHRASTVCKASDDNFIHKLSSHELNLCTSDIGSMLGRAVRAAKNSQKKLARAFTLKGTPRRVMQRAVSDMVISPNIITPRLCTTSSYGKCIKAGELDSSLRDWASSSSELSPGMSVSTLCSPQLGDRLPSSAQLQVPNHTYASKHSSLIFENQLDKSLDMDDY